MTLADLLARWESRRAEWARLGVAVDGEKVASEIVADLEAVRASRDDEELTLTQAARDSGLHADSIGRAIRQGRIKNTGRKNAPRVKRADVTALVERKRATGEKSRSSSSLPAITRDAIASKLPRLERG